jgi:hypothetical protein
MYMCVYVGEGRTKGFNKKGRKGEEREGERGGD